MAAGVLRVITRTCAVPAAPQAGCSAGAFRGTLITEITAEHRPKLEIKSPGLLCPVPVEGQCALPLWGLTGPYGDHSALWAVFNPILAKLTSVPPVTSATALGLKPAPNSLCSIRRQQQPPRLTSCLKTKPTTAATRTMRKMRDRSMEYCGQKGRDGMGWMGWGRTG